MCELFAVNAKTPFLATPYLAEFFDHSHRHPHGWGISWLDESAPSDQHFTAMREPVAAFESKLLPQVLGAMEPHRHLMAHIRRSTCGTQSVQNCHPFLTSDILGNEWSMVHNGILFNEQLSASYRASEDGETDSERALLFFVDCLDEATLRNVGTLTDQQRFDVLASAVAQFSNLNRLNVIIDDGTYTYVHTNTDIVTLRYRTFPDEGAVVIATTPLGEPAEFDLWKPVPQYRLVAFRDGRIVRTSAPHGYVFCEAILQLRKVFGEDWLAA